MKAKDLGQLGGIGDTELTPVQCKAPAFRESARSRPEHVGSGSNQGSKEEEGRRAGAEQGSPPPPLGQGFNTGNPLCQPKEPDGLDSCLGYWLLSSIVEALGPATPVLGDQWLWERTGSLE